MTRSGHARRAAALLDRVIGLADEPTDDDDLRLRKRVVVIAGYILVVGPLQLQILASGEAFWAEAVRRAISPTARIYSQ